MYDPGIFAMESSFFFGSWCYWERVSTVLLAFAWQ